MSTRSSRRASQSSAAASPGGDAPVLDRDFHQTIVDNLADGVYYVDRDRRITYWNHGAEELTGYAAPSVLGRQCFDDFLKHVDASGRSLCQEGCPLTATMGDGRRREMEVWLRHHDGSRRAVRVRTAPIRRSGEIIGAVEIFDDAASLVAARDAAAHAEHDALTDELTGLANRRMFNLMLAARLEDYERYGTPVGLLICDLDRFKAVNDLHGHVSGDRVLQAVAATLRAGVRGSDLVARWGGEEFAIIANRTDQATLRELADRVRSLVAATEVPLPSGERVGPTISIGGTITRLGDSDGSLLRRADAALYRAKREGRNRAVLDEPA